MHEIAKVVRRMEIELSSLQTLVEDALSPRVRQDAAMTADILEGWVHDLEQALKKDGIPPCDWGVGADGDLVDPRSRS